MPDFSVVLGVAGGSGVLVDVSDLDVIGLSKFSVMAVAVTFVDVVVSVSEFFKVAFRWQLQG